MIQILVFLIKSIIRASQHLAVTSLELTTFAFIFAMLLASWFLKDKPQDINKPIILESKLQSLPTKDGRGFIY